MRPEGLPPEPAPSRWMLPEPALSGPDDIIALGADLAPGTLIEAYRCGMFPMHLPEQGALAWWSPWERGILPVDGMVISRSLARSNRRYETSVDRAFDRVIDGCADPARSDGWIDDDIREAYVSLHQLGWAHSIETWSSSGDLVGGLYGVSIGGLFAGESMFHRERDASKVALIRLVEIMRSAENALIDVQWVTDHLESLGAVAISRSQYLARLELAITSKPPNEFLYGSSLNGAG